MSEEVIFYLERNGQTCFRVIASSDVCTEQAINPDNSIKFNNIFDSKQAIAMAKAILEYYGEEQS